MLNTHHISLHSAYLTVSETLFLGLFLPGKLASKVYEDMRKRVVSTKIQTNFRRYTLRTSYNRLRHAVVLIQTGLRAMAARYELRYRRRHKAATKLEAKWRGHRDYKRYKKLTKATVVTQSGWRGRVARRELRRLKMAAKDTGALQLAKENLEKQVRELTQRLELQIRLKTELEEALRAKEGELATKSPDEVGKIDHLTSEVERLTALLESERQRADESEKKYAEAQETIETMRLEETERKALLESERQRANESEKKYVEAMETIKIMKTEVTERRALLESEKQLAEKSEKKHAEALDMCQFEETERMTELNDTLLTKERESATEASNAALSIVKEAIFSMKDGDNIENLTPKEEKQQTESEDGLLVKDRESAMEVSGEKFTYSKESPVSVEDSEKIGSQIPEVKHLTTELEGGLLTQENESAAEASSIAQKVPVFLETEKIESLTAEMENLKALLESERQRADEFEKKFSEALETIEVMRLKLEETEKRVLQLQEAERRSELNEAMPAKEHVSAMETSDKALSLVKDAPLSVDETGKIESLTAEVKNLKILLESERQRADESEKKYAEALESINIMRLKLEDTERKTKLEDQTLDKEHVYPMEASDEALSIGKKATGSVEDTEKIKSLNAEVENLKALVELERQRADECEKKYTEALESSEIKRQKLEETERRVLQLQDALNRMIYSMSDQFSELKSMLCASSSSSVTSGYIIRDGFGDATSTSSDITSTDSDFTFPAPVSTTTETVSSLSPGAFQMIVHDLSVPEKQPGSENWESDREGAFDDFF